MSCPLCNSSIEDSDHLFMRCPAALAVWFSSPLGIHVPDQLDLISWMKVWLSAPDTRAQQLFCYSLWLIWSHRNQLVFNQSVFEPIVISKKAASLVEEFNSVNPPRNSPPASALTKWIPPPSGYVKINVDAGCFSDGTTGWGMVVRNAAGLVLFAETRFDGISVSPLVAECMGLRWCLARAMEKQLCNVIVELDAESVVNCLHGASLLVDIAPLILDCLEYLSKLENVSVCSISRNCNKVAHSLASLAKHVGCNSWEGFIPDPCLIDYCNDFPYL